MMMVAGNMLVILLVSVCTCQAAVDEQRENDVENPEDLVKALTSTTEELVDLICSCRENENDEVSDLQSIDPMNPTPNPRDCYDIKEMGQTKSGIYDIFPFRSDMSDAPVRVWCDMQTDLGGWTVLQRREDGSVDFSRGWQDYKNGFGNVASEFWLGNENIHFISSQTKYELRIEKEEWDGKAHFTHYDQFRLTDESNKYTLLTGTYTGTPDVCVDPLGMESEKIKDNQITASTQSSTSVYRATEARLNVASGSWVAGTNNADQWIQVNFGVPKLVTGVVLQGRYNSGNWVKQYKVQYGNDGKTWQNVMDGAQENAMVFEGSTDQRTPVTSYFARPVKAIYIRILPTAWQGAISMRFELLGCEGQFFAYHNNQPFSTQDADNDAVDNVNCAVTRGAWWYRSCEDSDLNAVYLEGAGSTTRGIIWKDFEGQAHSLKRTEMKIRPVIARSTSNK